MYAIWRDENFKESLTVIYNFFIYLFTYLFIFFFFNCFSQWHFCSEIFLQKRDDITSDLRWEKFSPHFSFTCVDIFGTFKLRLFFFYLLLFFFFRSLVGAIISISQRDLDSWSEWSDDIPGSSSLLSYVRVSRLTQARRKAELRL